MKVKVKVKELRDLLVSEGIIPEHYSIRRFRQWKGELQQLYCNKHSWAGSQGCIGWIISDTENGTKKLSAGGSYNQNGRMTYDEPNIPCEEAIVRAGAEVGDTLIVHKWNDYNQTNYPFEDFYYHRITEEDLEKGEEIIAGLENQTV